MKFSKALSDEEVLTFDCCRTAFDSEEDSQNSIRNAIVQHVALPLNGHLTLVLMPNNHTAHNQIGCRMRGLVYIFIHRLPVAIGAVVIHPIDSI